MKPKQKIDRPALEAEISRLESEAQSIKADYDNRLQALRHKADRFFDMQDREGEKATRTEIAALTAELSERVNAAKAQATVLRRKLYTAEILANPSWFA